MEQNKLPFVHLHDHFEGSLADSALRCKEGAKRAKEYGMNALAITDHGFMYYVVPFYKACKDNDIKPIIGLETYVAPRKNTLKESTNDNANYHLVLLCENNQGYQNLLQIASDAALEGFYYKPRTDKEHLKMWHEGIIATSACLGGEVQHFLLEGHYDVAKETALQYDEIFGRGNFFLELQDHGMEEQHRINPLLIRMSQETGIPLVATNDCHYLTKESYEAHDVLMAIQASTTIDDDKRKKYPTDEFYLKSQEEMWKLFSYIPEALENTQKIADRCNVEIELGVNKIPEFLKIPVPYTKVSYLRKLVEEGAKERYGVITPEIQERIDYELSVINKMDHEHYFLIIWDVYRFAQENDILVGPGRGSGAGSVCLYALRVTQLDPLRYDLLFERFIDPSRVSLADVDGDFESAKRYMVIEYIIENYGQQSIAQIITFGSMAAKAALRNVGRALGTEADALAIQLSKMVPERPGIKLKDALEENPVLRNRYNDDVKAKKIIDIAMQVEGLPINTSTHAAGVLVVDQKGLTAHVPLARGEKGIVSQYAMGVLDDMHLLKLDILGLNTLDVIRSAMNSIYKNYGVKVDLYDLYKGEDPNVYKIIADGYTDGIFQLEGGGMTNFMKELKPDCLEDIIAGVALYRPGPMDMIPQFIEGKRKPETVHYDFPEVEPIFKETNGVMTYQEQCMKSAMALAGYQKHHSDSLRKAIGKKKKDLIAQHREWFIYGREENLKKGVDTIPGGIRMGHSEETLIKFYDKMEKFGKYAFNKSHAACYAIVAYVTAWLKTYYPVEYMAALMDLCSKDHDKIARYINHCKKDLNIDILPPDINESGINFTPRTDRSIRFTLFVKETKQETLAAIIKEREERGAFRGLNEFINRVALIADKATIKAIGCIGAFESLNIKRSAIIASTDDYFDKIQKWKTALDRYNKNPRSRRKSSPELSEWTEKEDLIPNIDEYPDDIKLRLEKSFLGIYLSGHPLKKYMCSISALSNFKLSELEYVVEEDGSVVMNSSVYDGQKVNIIIQVDNIFQCVTKKKRELMAIVQVSDLTGSAKVMVFHSIYMKILDTFHEDEIYQIKGSISMRSGEEPVILANQIIPLKESIHKRIIFNDSSIDASCNFVQMIHQLKIGGKTPVYIQRNNMRILLKRKYWVDIDQFEELCDKEILNKCKIKEW